MNETLDHKVYCKRCKVKTHHWIVAKHEQNSVADDDIHWDAKYYILQCCGCDTVAFAEDYGDEMMLDPQGNWYREIEFFPPEPESRSAFEISPKEYRKVPKFMYTVYQQIVQAYNSKSLLLTAIGLRTLIEAICIDRGVTGGTVVGTDATSRVQTNLQGKINGLVEGGFITETQSNVLHQIREMGNAATHKFSAPNVAVASDAIEVIEYVLHNIYEFHRYKLTP